jgi:hypothetical protein
MEITYIPMARGFVYLAAVVDLVQPEGSGMEVIDYAGNGVPSRGARGGSCPIWPRLFK